MATATIEVYESGKIRIDDAGITKGAGGKAQFIPWNELLAVANFDNNIFLNGAAANIWICPWRIEDRPKLLRALWRRLGALTSLGHYPEELVEAGRVSFALGPLLSVDETLARLRAANPGAAHWRLGWRLKNMCPGLGWRQACTLFSDDAQRSGKAHAVAETLFKYARESRVTLAWTADWPPEAFKHAVRKIAGFSPGSVFRILLCVAIVVAPLIFIQKRWAPTLEIAWMRQLGTAVALAFGCVLVCGLPLIIALRFSIQNNPARTKVKPAFSVCEIRGPCTLTRQDETQKSLWTDLSGFGMRRSEKDPAIRFLTVYLKEGGHRIVPLPRGEYADTIVRAFAEHLPLFDTEPELVKVLVTGFEWCLLYLWTVVVSAAAAYLLVVHRSLWEYVTLGMATLGPGTIAFAFRHPRQMFSLRELHAEKAHAYALAFNALGFMLMLLCSALLALTLGLHAI